MKYVYAFGMFFSLLLALFFGLGLTQSMYSNKPGAIIVEVVMAVICAAFGYFCCARIDRLERLEQGYEVD